MKELLSTVTTKGQVTIPVEVRRLLGIGSHEKIAFIVEVDQVRLARRSSVVERTAGVFRTNQAPVSAEELRAAGERAISDDVAERAKR